MNIEHLCFPLETAAENIEEDPGYAQDRDLIEPFRKIVKRLRAGEDLRPAVNPDVTSQVIEEFEARIDICKEILGYEDDPKTASDYRNEIADLEAAIEELKP